MRGRSHAGPLGSPAPSRYDSGAIEAWIGGAFVPDRTPYQKKVIERYYDQRDVIMLNKLQELVTELYLADTDKKRDRLWARAETAMKNLKVAPAIMAHILETQRPEVLAANVTEWLGTVGKRGRQSP